MTFPLFVFIGLFSVVFSWTAHATTAQSEQGGQVEFSATKDASHSVFIYKWRGLDGEDSAAFSLPNDTVRSDRTIFQDYPACLSAVFDALSAEKVRVEAAYGVKVSFIETTDGWTNSVTGPGEQPNLAQADLAQRNTILERAIFAERLYYRNPSGELQADPLAVAKKYAPLITPISDALITRGEPLRKTITRCLSFFQSIPYSTDLNVASFLSPVSLIEQNKGDCDTKCAAMAAVLLNYGVSSIFVTAEKHMLLGIAIPGDGSDRLITTNGVSYILAEPTGPALIPLGCIASDTILAPGKMEVSRPTL